MAAGGTTVPVTAGLAAGIALVVLFGLVFSPSLSARKTGITEISVEAPPKPRVGQALDITVRVTGTTLSCVYPHVSVTNANTSEVIWDSGNTIRLCDPDPEQRSRPVDINWALGGRSVDNENQGIGQGPVIVREAGLYKISAEFGTLKTSRTIEVFPQVVDVVIPKGSSAQSLGKTYEPKTVRVFLGMNNTVRWTNEDKAPHGIAADNGDDPGFYAATNSKDGPRLLLPRDSFEFTFTKAGEFGYHGEPGPWLTGTVIVMPDAPSASQLKPALSEKDAAEIVAKDVLARNPGAQVAGYPLSKNLPIMLYYFAPSGVRIAIDNNETKILGRCDPASLSCYPEYSKLDMQNDDNGNNSKDRLAYAVQVLVKKDKSAGYDDSAYYLVGANTGKIIYSSESEASALENVKADSLCNNSNNTSGSAGQKSSVKEPSMLPAGYHCTFKQGRQEEGVFVYWYHDLQGIPSWALGPKDSAGAIMISYYRQTGEDQGDLQQEHQSSIDELNQRGFPARLTHINNGSIAAVREYCDVCGMTTLIWYDYGGYHYLAESDLPSTTIIPVLRSMQ